MAAPRTTAAELVRHRVAGGGERFWKLADFPDLPASAVAQALSRMARAGELERITKGLYYRPRPTVLGPSTPSASGAAAAASAFAGAMPAGSTAANLLGFTTQNPARPDLAVTTGAAPRSLSSARVRTRRPASRASLSEIEAAILEFLRDRGSTSDLPSAETIARLLHVVGEGSTWTRLAHVAADEPPRVRAMIGAIGESLGKPDKDLNRLRGSINPLTRFDFGALAGLPFAREWQAR